MSAVSPDAGLVVACDGPVARLTIDRPASRNALSIALVDALEAAIGDLAAARTVRVAVLSGSGEAAFSAGSDLAAMANPGNLGEDGLCDLDRRLERLFQAIEQAPFPVIAAIRGHCIGGGLELAMACDLRIAAEDARFRMPPAMLGWVYALSGLRRFTAAIGPARARLMFLTGETLDAARAAEWGLVHESVPVAAWSGRVEALADAIARAAPLAISGLKHALGMLARGAVDPAAFIDHRSHRQQALDSADFAEARLAFAERRPPRFTGR